MDIIAQINNLLGDPSEIGGAIKGMEQTIVVIAMIPSLLQCFFGYKMLKFWIAFNGFCVGGIIGALIGMAVGGENGGAGMAAVILALILGILGAWLAFKLYMLGVFLQCFVMGFLFGAILGYFAGSTSAMVPVGIICALVAAIAGVILTKPIIIISTGLTGGLSVGVCLAVLFDAKSPAVGIVLGLILAALGIFVQFKMNEQESKQAVPQAPSYAVKIQQQFSEQQAQSDKFKASTAISENFKTKVKQDNEAAAKKAKGLTFDEVCENLEEIFYKNKILKYIMPFAEYLLYFLSALAILNIFFHFQYYLLTAIPLACCVLVLAKQKYGALAVSLTCLTIAFLLQSVGYFAYINFYNQFCFLLEFALCALFTVLAYRKFFTSENGIALRQKLAGPTPQSTNATPVIKIRCPGCGTLCNEDIAICPTCGKVLQVKTLQATQKDAETTITPVIPESNIVEEPEMVPQALFCPQCGHTCRPHAKFCPACGCNFATQTIETITQEPEESPQTMVCPQCGHSCKLTAKFCPECGQTLAESNKKASEEN